VAVAVEGVDMADLVSGGCESRRRDATSLRKTGGPRTSVRRANGAMETPNWAGVVAMDAPWALSGCWDAGSQPAEMLSQAWAVDCGVLRRTLAAAAGGST
jgi:hypothetical protein